MVQNQTLPSSSLPVGSDPVSIFDTTTFDPTSPAASSTLSIPTATTMFPQNSNEAPCDNNDTDTNTSVVYPQFHQSNRVSDLVLTDENSHVIGSKNVGLNSNIHPHPFNAISTITGTAFTTHVEIMLDNSPATANLLGIECSFGSVDPQKEFHEQHGRLDNEAGGDSNSSTPTMLHSRNDNSMESIDSLGSSSSGELFNSDYTDTVSSVDSAAFLVKPAVESDEEFPEGCIVGSQAVCTDGYMSYSNTEVLNDEDDSGDNENDDNDDDTQTQKQLLSQTERADKEEPETENSPMLPTDIRVDTSNASTEHTLTDFIHHTLSPIKENEMITFVIEDLEPSQYTRITDNVIIADESFLFNSSLNLGDVENGQHGKRAGTMSNLFERSSFLDLTEVSKVGRVCQKALVYLKDDMTLGSLVSLNTIVAKEGTRDPTQSVSLISERKTQGVIKKSNYMKNLIGLSLTITLLYIAIGSVRNLQSSINHKGGVGVIGLAVNFVGYVLGSMFSSSIVQSFQPRRCIIANLFPNLLYIAANLYPTMWVMIPISLVQGVSLAIISNASSTYITFLAKGCAEKKKQSFARVSGEFFGIYMLIYQSYMIVGNLIASLILAPPSGDPSGPKSLAGLLNASQTLISTNESSSVITMDLNETANAAVPSHIHLCGSGFCHHFEIGGAMFSVDLETKIFLFGVYIGCLVLAVFTAFFMMEPLNKSLFATTVSPFRQFKSQMSSLARFSVNIKFVFLLPLLMYSATQFTFMSAEFVKGYVSCPLGLHMIGYTMICFGICSSAGSYFCGLFSKYIGRIPFVVAAALINLGCLIFTLKWQPHPDSLIPFFLIMGLWGITDGIWNTQASSLMGIIFPDKCEEAYAGLRITQGLSAAVAFGYSSILCMTAKIYITTAICFLTIVGYLVMEALHRSDMKKSNLIFKPKQTAV